MDDTPDLPADGNDDGSTDGADDGAKADDRPPRLRRGLVATLLAVAVVAVAADQSAKAWALANLSRTGPPREVVPGWLELTLVFNPGAAFNMATGTTWIFTVIATFVAVLILRASRRLGSRGWAVALGLLLGGAVGNLLDRLTREPGFARGHVVDFIHYLKFPFMDFPVFNVADSCITVAAVLIGLLGLRGIALDGTRVPHDGPPTRDGAERGAGEAAGA